MLKFKVILLFILLIPISCLANTIYATTTFQNNTANKCEYKIDTSSIVSITATTATAGSSCKVALTGVSAGRHTIKFRYVKDNSGPTVKTNWSTSLKFMKLTSSTRTCYYFGLNRTCI